MNDHLPFLSGVFRSPLLCGITSLATQHIVAMNPGAVSVAGDA